jgi:hypothetical protein
MFYIGIALTVLWALWIWGRVSRLESVIEDMWQHQQQLQRRAELEDAPYLPRPVRAQTPSPTRSSGG